MDNEVAVKITADGSAVAPDVQVAKDEIGGLTPMLADLNASFAQLAGEIRASMYAGSVATHDMAEEIKNLESETERENSRLKEMALRRRGGTSGGGYAGACPEIGEPILLANAAYDGPGKEVAAALVKAGDWVWTRHEISGEWGAFQVTGAKTILSPIMRADGFPRTSPSHRFWLDSWTRMDAFGEPDGEGFVRVLTVNDAAT